MLAPVCGALTAATVCEMHLLLKGATLLPFNFCAFVLLSLLRMLSVTIFFNILAAKLLQLGQKLAFKTQHKSHKQIPASTMPSYRKQIYKRGGWMLAKWPLSVIKHMGLSNRFSKTTHFFNINLWNVQLNQQHIFFSTSKETCLFICSFSHFFSLQL